VGHNQPCSQQYPDHRRDPGATRPPPTALMRLTHTRVSTRLQEPSPTPTSRASSTTAHGTRYTTGKT
jgi:hypothetical protein